MADTKPKILVVTVASWNSKVGSNTWTTLLENYGSENIANICIRDENPDNPVCSRYFSISESKVIKSIFKRNIKTGCEKVPGDTLSCTSNESLDEHNARYSKMKKKRRYSMLLARELIWKIGKWHTKELDAFLDDFKPDIILHSMEGYIHLNRIILYAIKHTRAKAVGYIWDDNFTYKQSSKPGYILYRFFQRGSLKRLANKTNDFFAISEMTKKEADEFFGINCHILTKPLNSYPTVKYGDIQKPIKLLYTGNLYIGRDMSLLKVVKAIEKLENGTFTVDVYTKSEISENVKAQLNTEICHIHPPVSQSEVLELQKKADVLLFLEDIDGPDALAARLSFSTKTTDYLSSGRCIFAVGNSDTAPMQYFKSTSAAITACSIEEITEKLEDISNNTALLPQYAAKGAAVGIEKHDKKLIQDIFNQVILSVYN